MPPSHMPTFGCEHLNRDKLEQIESVRDQRRDWLEDLVQYTCLSCDVNGPFKGLDQHFAKTKHEFAINSKNVYCGGCKDIVYDPSFFPTRKRKSPTLTEEDEAYITQNTLPKPCGREGVRGLFNLGETCYMNAILQMMVHNTHLAHYFLGMGHPIHSCPISKEPEKKNDSDDSDDENEEDKDQKTCVACAMTDLFSEAHTVDQPTPAQAVNLLFASWKHIPHMSGKGQQDAQEWYTIIIDKLHESAVNPTQNPAFKPNLKRNCPCFFHKIFYGRFRSAVTCDVCRKSTVTEPEFSSIDLDFQKQKKRKKKQLKEAAAAAATHPSGSSSTDTKSKKNQQPVQTPIPIPTLAECLKAYTTPEALSQDSQQIDCQTCKQKQPASKKTCIRSFPSILAMHIKRFGIKKPPGAANGANGNSSSMIGVPEKYEGKLDFPLEVNMGPYSSTAEIKEFWNEYGEYRGPNNWYDLECVVVHQGDHAHTGHYYCFCRVAMGSGLAKRWFKFDDEIVSATTLEEVLRQEAYLLFYSAREMTEREKNMAHITNGVAKKEVNGD